MPSFIEIPEILTSGGPLGQSRLNGVPRDREEFRSWKNESLLRIPGPDVSRKTNFYFILTKLRFLEFYE